MGNGTTGGLPKDSVDHESFSHPPSANAWATSVAIFSIKLPSNRSLASRGKDDYGNEQPIYYVSRTLKDAKTRYPRIEKACLVIIYASQRLKRYFSAYQILLVTKSHPIKALLHQPLLTERIAQ